MSAGARVRVRVRVAAGRQGGEEWRWAVGWVAGRQAAMGQMRSSAPVSSHSGASSGRRASPHVPSPNGEVNNPAGRKVR